LLRGPQVSFSYSDILRDVRGAVADGFYEIVLTGVDIASWAVRDDDGVLLISDLCKMLLWDVPEIRRLRLSSMDPASPQIPKIIDLMNTDARMMPHMHLSMQSGSDLILTAMRRRHTAATVRNIMNNNKNISFSWDIICGFPGETDELFNDTAKLARDTGVIKIHAFPFSPRPGTVAATMPDQVPRNIARERVHKLTQIADENKREFMQKMIGQTVQILVEDKNTARDPNDIDVEIAGASIPSKTICDVKLESISNLHFIAKVLD
jgi:threonylcarbamoyladenosine tRNA methylthiotransferase MtaB